MNHFPYSNFLVPTEHHVIANTKNPDVSNRSVWFSVIDLDSYIKEGPIYQLNDVIKLNYVLFTNKNYFLIAKKNLR